MLSVTLLVAIALLAIAFKLSQRKCYRLPPGPKHYPVLGNLPELLHQTFIKGQAPFVTFADWAFKASSYFSVKARNGAQLFFFLRWQHGPICYVRFFRQRVIIVSDARVAQQLCVGQADKFSERPPGLFLARVLKGKGVINLDRRPRAITIRQFTGIVFNDGPSWKEHRSFLNHEFRKFGFGHHSIEPSIQHVVDEYLVQIGVSATSRQLIARQVIESQWFK